MNRIRRWDPTQNKTVVAVESHDAILPRVSALSASPKFIFVGGLGGELIAVSSRSTRAHLFRIVSEEADNIVNHISGNMRDPTLAHIVVSCNDRAVRMYDLEGLRMVQQFPLAYAANASCVNPESNLICIAGDSPECPIYDIRSGAKVDSLVGHYDYSFACAWSPDGRYLVTGNQDHTARLYDVRQLSHCLSILPSSMAAVRGLSFSPDSTCLAMMEADDYVHLYDMTNPQLPRQTIDFFGETAGIDFSPDGEHLYCGLAGMERGGIFDFDRVHAGVHDQYSAILL